MRERITSGEYRAGDRLPSEAELCALYGVSRMTVRRAVTLLVQDGVVSTENGRGTFVKAPEAGPRRSTWAACGALSTTPPRR